MRIVLLDQINRVLYSCKIIDKSGKFFALPETITFNNNVYLQQKGEMILDDPKNPYLIYKQIFNLTIDNKWTLSF